MVTQSVTVTIELTEEQLRAARSTGVLEPDELARLVQRELERRQDARRMNEIMDALQSSPEKPTPEEIDAEIEAYRSEKRARRASGD